MEKIIDPSKRRFLSGRIRQEQVLRLPWVVSESVFTSQCTQCQSCLSACETQIIVRDSQGFPKIDFSKGECTFCQKCIQLCSEPLFTLPKKQLPCDLDEIDDYHSPWPIKLDISDKCLAKNNIYCQSCRDECEPNAIKFSYISSGKVSSIPQPEINLTDCSQCGACISSCPQDAITIDFLTQNQQDIESNNAIKHQEEVMHAK